MRAHSDLMDLWAHRLELIGTTKLGMHQCAEEAGEKERRWKENTLAVVVEFRMTVKSKICGSYKKRQHRKNRQCCFPEKLEAKI